MSLLIVLAVLGGINLILVLILLLRGSGSAIRFEERFSALKSNLERAEQAIIGLTQLNEQKLENMRQAVETNLKSIQEDNSRKLEQMRATVDEKLQTTLEARLGASFAQVSERLESVYKGLGEMQKLASEVGNLKSVLSNIKTRGTLGEIQLEKILEQLLSPEQYAKNVKINGGMVEFAIKLPGKNDEPVLLPIDSKFPLSEYEKLVCAQEQADKTLVEECGKSLEAGIKLRAREITKYISPPKTTDFAIIFLPVEGMYAEVLRRPELFECLHSQYRIAVTGPATFAAFLNSLQMGFKTLAVEKRATEVAKLLGAVKTDFGKFSEILESVKRNLEVASNKIDEATSRTRMIGKKLKDVQALPSSESAKLLEPADDTEDVPES